MNLTYSINLSFHQNKTKQKNLSIISVSSCCVTDDPQNLVDSKKNIYYFSNIYYCLVALILAGSTGVR